MQKAIKYFGLIFYYGFLIFLPSTSTPFIGKPIEIIRRILVKIIFKKCDTGVTIEKGARFGRGFDLCIGKKSGLGKNCRVPDNIIIGDYVMMGNNVTIFSTTHNFDRIDIPILKQGVTKFPPFVIEDDVWIGQGVIILPKVGKIKKGTIIGAGAVVTKSFPEYSILGGNPAKQIGSRIS